MARIRSIHPGIFTDEAFMSASAEARLLIFGLWCEAWDDGVFEWKPMTLKVRIFPSDTVDVLHLLDELEGLGFLRRFEAKGKNFGAIRNFQKFQRPKKPNSSKVLPPEFHSYVGVISPEGKQSPTGTEPVGDQSDTISPRRMEDGGERREEEHPLPPQPKTGAEPSAAGELRKSIIEILNSAGRMPIDTARAEVWLAQGYRADVVAAVIRDVVGRNKKFNSLSYFDGAIRDAHAVAPPPAATPPPKKLNVTDEWWHAEMTRWKRNGCCGWINGIGWHPEDPRTDVPPHILAEFGIVHGKAEEAA